MVKLESLFCPKCHMATMQEHPEANHNKDTPFNHLYKCNHCSYTICKTTHEEKADKMPACKYKKPRKPFGKE